MRKETDLRQVKATARALLMLDLGETDFSPMIVKHPFGGRNEAEVIVDPKHLMDITEVQDINNGFTMTM